LRTYRVDALRVLLPFTSPPFEKGNGLPGVGNETGCCSVGLENLAQGKQDGGRIIRFESESDDELKSNHDAKIKGSSM
jgi:hypothetical protein